VVAGSAQVSYFRILSFEFIKSDSHQNLNNVTPQKIRKCDVTTPTIIRFSVNLLSPPV
jgi:hypothetical protein